MDWNNIINWKLLVGSHEFPGPDGGTCINEAAIVAAGFQYKSVSSVMDCPPCFSRVLGAYAIKLNDCLPDDLRQDLLMPFVTRLAGTADTSRIERQRFDFISLGLIRTVLPITLRGWRDDLADKCEYVTNYNQAIDVVNSVDFALDLIGASAPDLAFVLGALEGARAFDPAHALDITLDRNFALVLDIDGLRVRVLDLAAVQALAAAHARALVALLDGAMKIGKQAEPIEPSVVVARMARIRQAEAAPS